MKREPVSGEAWFCKDFPFQESKEVGKDKTRPVLIIDYVDDDNLLVMMLTTGKRVSQYDVYIKASDIVEGKTKQNSRARVFILRVVPKRNLTDRIFVLNESKILDIMDMMYTFEANAYSDSEHFRDFCTFLNIKKITDIEGRKILSIEEFEESREATGLDIALINHEICNKNRRENTLGYITWDYHSGRMKVCHVVSLFKTTKGVSSLHYLGDGYSTINDTTINNYSVAMVRIIKLYLKAINEERRRTESQEGFKVLDKEEMKTIDETEYRGMLVSEFLKKFITSAPPAILESVERFPLYDLLQG